jgi:hypothetical protein
MSNKKIYVERRSEGDYAVRRAGSDRASAVELTQRAAIESWSRASRHTWSVCVIRMSAAEISGLKRKHRNCSERTPAIVAEMRSTNGPEVRLP